MPFVESNYRTLNDRDSRAIGGFSRGGNQGLSFGLNNLDKFSYLCSYSSFTSMNIPEVYDKARKTNRKINLFWLGVGTDDFLYGNAKEYMEFLDSKGIRNIQYFTSDKMGHTWMNARHFLSQTFPLLFNEDAAEKAMKEAAAAKPAPDKTAKQEAPAAKPDNQRLTPELMAKLFPPGVVSPEYNKDGSATFRVLAPEAEKVELECQMFGGTRQMVKGVPVLSNSTVLLFARFFANVPSSLTAKYSVPSSSCPVSVLWNVLPAMVLDVILYAPS